jgi:tyrosyl-tRNA synthetase
MKTSLLCAGVDKDKVDEVKFVLASELYAKLGNDYWKDVLSISKETSVKRMLRCTTIVGRSETDAVLPMSALLYPAMQSADIWALEADIAHAGMDQRKVHVLAREWGEKHGKTKPVAIHGQLLTGLSGPGRMDASVKSDGAMHGGVKSDASSSSNAASSASSDHAHLSDEQMMANKMSKSKPDSCIFIHDSEEEIKRKMAKAYCPPRLVENNPIIEMAEAFVLRDKPLTLTRPAKFGGDVTFTTASELQSAYGAGTLHPMDLKNAVAAELIQMLEPSRKYFEKHSALLQTLA